MVVLVTLIVFHNEKNTQHPFPFDASSENFVSKGRRTFSVWQRHLTASAPSCLRKAFSLLAVRAHAFQLCGVLFGLSVIVAHILEPRRRARADPRNEWKI